MKFSNLPFLSGLLAPALTNALHAQLFYWDPAAGGNGHYYETVAANLSWTDAKAAAEARGGYLATITSEEENNFVFSLTTPEPYGPWLGGYQTDKLNEPAGHWAWVTGEPFSYTAWVQRVPNQPDNWNDNEDYLHYTSIAGPAPVWNDIRIDGEDLITSYIVEYNVSPVPEPWQYGLVSASLLGSFALWRRHHRPA